jgi:hypothetical protein
MAPGDSILLSRPEIDLIASEDFQACAPAEIAARLLFEAGQAEGAQYYALSLVNIHQSVAHALRVFATESPASDEVKLGTNLAEKIERLAVISAD